MISSTCKYEKHIFNQTAAILQEYANGRPFTLDEFLFDDDRGRNPRTRRCPFHRKGDLKKWFKSNRDALMASGLYLTALSNGDYHVIQSDADGPELIDAVQSLADEHLKMAGVYLEALQKLNRNETKRLRKKWDF